MDTDVKSRLNFCATFKNFAQVKKYGKIIDASFVKIDCANKSDIKALKKVSMSWTDAYYAKDIYDVARQKFKSDKLQDYTNFYALTLQKNSFEKLNPDDILGITEVANKKQSGAIHLVHIEAKPKLIEAQNRIYNKIGTAMIKSLQEMYTKIELIARKSDLVSNFYKKNGFWELPEFDGFFFWMKDSVDSVNSKFL